MKRMTIFLAAAFVSVALFSGAVSSTVSANSASDAIKIGAKDVKTDEQSDKKAKGIVNDVTNVLLYVVGAISVIMLIVGGLLYALSAGDANKVKQAKNTILYAVIGLVVAFFAYAIVRWVWAYFDSSDEASSARTQYQITDATSRVKSASAKKADTDKKVATLTTNITKKKAQVATAKTAVEAAQKEDKEKKVDNPPSQKTKNAQDRLELRQQELKELEADLVDAKEKQKQAASEYANAQKALDEAKKGESKE